MEGPWAMSDILWATVLLAVVCACLYMFFRHLRERIHKCLLEGCVACCLAFIAAEVVLHGYEALDMFHHFRGADGSGTPRIVQVFERPEMHASLSEYYLRALLDYRKDAVPASDAAPGR
jgi:hypothetical protein